MSDPIFDLEQQIMECWSVIEDIDTVTEWFMEDPKWKDMDVKLQDAMMNKYFSIKELYELKFDKLFAKFELVSQEYHRKSREFEEADFPMKLDGSRDKFFDNMVKVRESIDSSSRRLNDATPEEWDYAFKAAKESC